ncbi:integrator complex subunit 7 [Uranotaenia lowii]|uniref:integrator complex subunit 7 n=1 Tax=Uranotaenia lowii TaxID=190385 RepID=UPI00247923A6|nr:integrator complex subunit 7 [Uranotaenia lowii]
MSLRTNVFNENLLNETDQDFNSVLIELDKGLRSTKIGEQCEAIIRFPKLFEKYPFPILINSSFLKLAEFFRIGSNLSRLWVLRVCQQSEKHLEKILDVDEFLKRIFMVSHSNDPVARALTLRTLGAVACVIAEKQQIHHAIRNALDSHDTVEVEAAIYASVQFAAQSKCFAVGMCSKVSSMIESLQTPVSMKILLIPVLRHMHHDANTAALVRTLCHKLLPMYPSDQFTIAIIQTLSKLSFATLVDIPEQVDTLLIQLADPRKKVQYAVLQCMNRLAEKGAYLWTKHAINKLLKQTMQCCYPDMALNIIITLTGCQTTCHTMLNEERSHILAICKDSLLLVNNIAGKALTILTRLVSYCYKEDKTPPMCFLEYLNMNLEYLTLSALHNKVPLTDLKIYLKCCILYSNYNTDFRENISETMTEMLIDGTEHSTPHLKLVCEALGAICANFSSTCFDSSQSRNQFNCILGHILKKLESYTQLSANDKDNTAIVEILVTICLQSVMGRVIPPRMFRVFDNILKITNLWTQYRISRAASRYGQHILAAMIYQKLAKHVSLEKLNCFLIAMFQISKAECILNYGMEYESIIQIYPQITDMNASHFSLLDRLEKSVDLYCMAVSTLKATSSPQYQMIFQTEIVNLRCQFLQSLHNLVVLRNTLCIAPPSAISNTLAQNMRDPLQKFGHITNQLRKNIKNLKACEDAYSKLFKSSFDADPCSLEYLNGIQYLCSVLQFSLEMVAFTTPAEFQKHPPVSSYPETKYLLSISQTVYKHVLMRPNETNSAKTITNKHMDILLKQIEIIVKSSHCLPRFYFQVLQNTSLKLAVTPQPRIVGEPIFVQPSSSLVIKVEGVIQHHEKKYPLFRYIDCVQLTLTSHILNTRLNEPKVNMDPIVLSQKVKPHHDFFNGNFILSLQNIMQSYPGTSFFLGGQWQVTLESCGIDQHGVLWNTGPKSVIHVRIPDDNHKQSASSQSGPRRF